MNLDDCSNLVDIANGTINLLGHLPKVIDTIKSFRTNNGFEFKTSEEEDMNRLKEYLKHNKKDKEENKRCTAILKKYNLQWQILNRKLGQVEQYKCCSFYPWTISGQEVRVQWR